MVEEYHTMQEAAFVGLAGEVTVAAGGLLVGNPRENLGSIIVLERAQQKS